ncbi:MAG: DEAD/DEAH box helicase [Corynebacteriales bacterium]|nr:DEAD/DEAH box helicase [Mycobacteriales bacterium]
MSTPAARERSAHPVFTEFAAGVGLELDEFQINACHALERGHGVLVCAPTGAGKTIVGEFAVHIALQQGRKCFYTTPIKALSNQKFHDLARQHGQDNVGLLTGDNSINAEAPIVVMTTEVLRNMLYAGSATLAGLGYVVMDEVHYLADRFRGAVWEEVIIHLPESVALVSLSATVSNAEEFAEWLITVRGHTEVIVSEHRPVPLWQHMLVGKKMFDLFADEQSAQERRVHPELVRATRDAVRKAGALDMRGRRSRGPRFRGIVPSRADVIERLDRDGLLPAITFIFSRAGCAAAVQQCLNAGLRLTTSDEQQQIRRLAEQRTSEISADDLHVLGYWEWLDGLQRGVAAHHAGMLPVFKEVVEELFLRGLVKAVFATETLALGINMPARSVVLERLVKYNGEAHVDITPGEYTQLTGRAGRRGIDVEGHAVVLWSPEVDPQQVAGLASTRTYPLKSSFAPSYNMAVNLVATVGADKARELLETSFAQFQADRAVVGVARKITRNREALQSYAEAMACHLGDFAEYSGIRRAIKERERVLSRDTAHSRRAAAAMSLEKLKIGDVIIVPGGRRSGFAVVVDPGLKPMSEPRPLVVSEDRWSGRLSLVDFPDAVRAIAHMRVPRNFNHRSPQARRDLVSSLRTVMATLPPEFERPRRKGRAKAADDEKLLDLRRALRSHPCHGCADREDHARWGERYWRLERDTAALENKVHNRTSSLARTFDKVCAVLTARGYLNSDGLTAAGTVLSRIWAETDLLIAECVRAKVWEKLNPAELAAAVSALVFESRGGDTGTPGMPAGPISEALASTVRLWGELDAQETEHGLSLTREPDLGFVWPVLRWARGEGLPRALAAGGGPDNEMPAGDFVRWARQVIDLLDQISKIPGGSAELRANAVAAIGAIRTGVVAYSSM